VVAAAAAVAAAATMTADWPAVGSSSSCTPPPTHKSLFVLLHSPPPLRSSFSFFSFFAFVLSSRLFSVTIVYFAAGFAFNKWYRKEEGIQNQIPQYDFWVSLPGLVKDGCVYSYRKTMNLVGRGSNPEYLG
jgi:hypothetical protein